MPCGATQERRAIVERSDKMWSPGEGNGKPLLYSCLENPMNSIKGTECLVKMELQQLPQWMFWAMINLTPLFWAFKLLPAPRGTKITPGAQNASSDRTALPPPPSLQLIVSMSWASSTPLYLYLINPRAPLVSLSTGGPPDRCPLSLLLFSH